LVIAVRPHTSLFSSTTKVINFFKSTNKNRSKTEKLAIGLSAWLISPKLKTISWEFFLSSQIEKLLSGRFFGATGLLHIIGSSYLANRF